MVPVSAWAVPRTPLALAAVAATLLAAPALAQTKTTFSVNETRPTAGEVTNPCNGEPVPFEGVIHFLEKVQVQADGRIHFVASHNFHAEGLGTMTQLKYTVGGTMNINSKFPSGPITFRQRTKVVSEGPKDNFFATFVFVVNGNGEQTQVRLESDCQG